MLTFSESNRVGILDGNTIFVKTCRFVAPKVRAMEIIDELEKEKRGPYAGCIGYFGADGEMDTCIVLRTAVVKDGRMAVQAGAGIVYDSDPELEQQECINKAKAQFRAAEDAVRFAMRARRGQ